MEARLDLPTGGQAVARTYQDRVHVFLDEDREDALSRCAVLSLSPREAHQLAQALIGAAIDAQYPLVAQEER